MTKYNFKSSRHLLAMLLAATTMGAFSHDVVRAETGATVPSEEVQVEGAPTEEVASLEESPDVEEQAFTEDVSGEEVTDDADASITEEEVDPVVYEEEVSEETAETSTTTTTAVWTHDAESNESEVSNLTLAAGESTEYSEDSSIWRIENGQWHIGSGKVSNHGTTDATLLVRGDHYYNDSLTPMWDASFDIPAGQTIDIYDRSLSYNASNASYLYFENQSTESAITIDDFFFTSDGAPSYQESKDAAIDEKEEVLRDPEPGFRVLPYLQAPSPTSMSINWISEFDTAGTLTIAGDQSEASATFNSNPEYLPILEYTLQEIREEISFDNGNGVRQELPKGEWLESDKNYKHTIHLTNLEPNTVYTYVVEQDGVKHEAQFKTFPTKEEWDSIKLIAFSDTETEAKGELENREWMLHPSNPYAKDSELRPELDSYWAEKYGNNRGSVRYPLTQQEALNENLRVIQEANADALIIAGDLTQGGGYQGAWDEFWRHFAGEFTDTASNTPLLTALGNWETVGGVNGGYGTPESRLMPVIGRNKYHAYIETEGNPNAEHHKDSYYRVDIGPVTLITLDSTNGIPDETVDNPTGERYTDNDSILREELWVNGEGQEQDPYISTDTQGMFRSDEYADTFAREFDLPVEQSDLPNFNPGTEQWRWAEEQLKDAREKGQIILVQFHHASYSSGVHGTPPNFEQRPDNQSGVAMRVYSPLFEKYGVATVIAGHDEMFERSFVDLDGDGMGFHVYDVGVAADGLRTEATYTNDEGEVVEVNYNTHSVWSATENEPELWATNENGVKHLVDGGLHYGHLEMTFDSTSYGAQLVLEPVYVFPILDDEYNLIRTERRVYSDVVTLYFDENGLEITAEEVERRLAEIENTEEAAVHAKEVATEGLDLPEVLDNLDYDLYDIFYGYENGEEVASDAKHTVILQKRADGTVVDVYHLGDHFEVVEKLTFLQTDSEVIFETDAFSYFSVVYGVEDIVTPATPKAPKAPKAPKSDAVQTEALGAKNQVKAPEKAVQSSGNKELPKTGAGSLLALGATSILAGLGLIRRKK